MGLRYILATLFALILPAVAHAQGVPPGCEANTPCVVIERTGTAYPSLFAAFAAAQDGDVLDANPAVYAETDVYVTRSITLNCYGDTTPDWMTVEPGCILDPAQIYWNYIAAGQTPPKYAGIVGKGALIIGRGGVKPPTVNIWGWEFRNATAYWNSGTSPNSCSGITVQPMQPAQCDDSSVGGIRGQMGNITCHYCVFDHDSDGFLGEPFQWGEPGSIVWFDHSLFWYDGTGAGQQHAIYCSRWEECKLTNSMILDVWNGNGFKNRGFISDIENDVIGDSKACADNGVALPTWTPSTLVGINSAWAGGTSNEINSPDGGNVTDKNNIFCKAAQNSNSAFIDDDAGSVTPWPGIPGAPGYPLSSYVQENDTFYNEYSGAILIWNPQNNPNLTSTGATVVGTAPSAYINGMGTMSGTLNGAAFSFTGKNWPPMLQQFLPSSTTLYDERGTTGPQTVAMTGADAIALGGSGLMTVSHSGGGLAEAWGGTGGMNVTGGISYVVTQAGAAPSTVTESGAGSVWLNADGDTLDLSHANCNAGEYLQLAGRDQLVTWCPNTTTTGLPYLYSKATHGYVPSGTITVTGWAKMPELSGSSGFGCVDGCNYKVVGQANQAGAAGHSGWPVSQAAQGPSTVWFDLSVGSATSSTPLDFVITGGAYEIDTCCGFSDYSDPTPTSENLIGLTPGPVTVPFTSAQNVINSTIDLNGSTGSQWRDGSTTDSPFGDTAAWVVGSGSGFLNLDGRTTQTPAGAPPAILIEVAPASLSGIPGAYGGPITQPHATGGTFSMGNLGKTQATHVVFEALGGESLTCSGTTTLTLTASDGTAITTTGGATCANIISTPLPDAADVTLTGAAAAGQSGATIAIPVTLTDAWGAAHTGEGYVSISSSDPSDQIILNGITAASGGTANTMLGRTADIAAALTSLHVILGSAGAHTLTVSYWNAGNGTASTTIPVTVSAGASTAVSCTPATLTAPVAPGTPICPITVQPSGWAGGLSVSDTTHFGISGSNLVAGPTPPGPGSMPVTITATP